MHFSRFSSTAGRIHDEGFVLVAVLWLLAALAALVSTYAAYVVNAAAEFALHDENLQAEALISAALELTAIRLKAPEDARSTRGRFGFQMGQGNVAVKFQSEAARIDLNAAPRELLAGLFTAIGARSTLAETYANRVIGWRTAPSHGDADEAATYRTRRIGYGPRQAAFPHLQELSLVLDIPPIVVARALPFLTVYSGLAKVNLLDAEPEVLSAIPRMSRERLNSLLMERKRMPSKSQELTGLLGEAQAYAGFEDSRAIRVTVDVSFKTGRRIASDVVILAFDDGDEPYGVLSWEDLPERASDTQSLTSSR